MAKDSREARFLAESFDIIVREADQKKREKKLSELHSRYYSIFKFRERAKFRQNLPIDASEWNRFIITYDAATSWKRVRCPVLSLNGSNDIQVSPAEHQGAIAAALAEAKNEDVTIVVVPGVNHLFQTVKKD